MDKTAFGKFLAELRNEKNWTQETLSEKLNVSSKTISKWECGSSSPDLDTLFLIAEIFNVSLYELTKYKRIKNPLISKKDIQRIINKNSIKKLVFIKIIMIILIVLTLIGAIFSTTYTINNYNKVQVYELISNDENFHVDGILIKTKNKYSLSISNVSYIQEKNKPLIKNIAYTIKLDDFINERKELSFEKNISLNSALLNIKIKYIDYKINNNVYHFDFILNYTKNDNTIEEKTIKLSLHEIYSNDTLL